MDPNGGMNPSAPKLDNTQPPTDIYSEPQTFDQPTSASIPSEMPAGAPVMQDQFVPAMPPVAPPIDQMYSPVQAPQFQGQMQDINSGYQQPIDPDPMLNQPMAEQPMPKQPGGARKAIFITVLSVVGLVVLAGIAYASYTAGTTKGQQQAATDFQNQQAETQQAESSDQSTQEPVTLDLSSLVTPTYKDEEIKGAIQEQKNASDGFVLYVTDIQRGFQTDDASYKLDEGKELVKVNFVMGNIADNGPKDIKSADLYLEEGDGTKVTPESRLSEYEGDFDTVKIESGQQASGSIVFAVTKDITPLVFVRDQTYRITNQNKEYTTKTLITVADK